jgi:tryptophan synthase alpha subunit
MLKQIFKTNKKAFIPFIMVGHPSMEDTRRAILGLASAGADLIELGVPFSDPAADGPINQAAAEIALRQGVTLKQIINLVQSIRKSGCETPILLFSYFNPILAFGEKAFVTAAVSAGIQGVLVVDLPAEEGLSFYQQARAAHLGVVLLASPTTSPSRFTLYHHINPSFIYYISRCAVTGVQETLSQTLAVEIQALRTYFPHHPIAVGFGISTIEQAQAVASFAEGVVVGSGLVKALETSGITAFLTLAKHFANSIHGV